MERFAIVQVNGKQYLAHKGGRIVVDRMNNKEGDQANLKEVLLVQDGTKTLVGAPYVAHATVGARVIAHRRGPKGQAFRYARKKRVRKVKGYRAAQTELEITELSVTR